MTDTSIGPRRTSVPPTAPVRWRRGDRRFLVIAAFGGAVLSMVAAGIAFGYRNPDLWGAFGLPVVLAVLTAPFIVLTQRHVRVPLGGLLALGMGVKFLGSYARYLMVFEYYEGGDSMGYLATGAPVAAGFWDGTLGLGDLWPTERGTQFIGEFTGIVLTIVGPGAMGAFMVFGWLAFLGAWMFIAAARRALPTIDLRRYALFVLFLPSMAFWPSSVGKDAWMVFGLGLFALGAARVITAARFGFTFLLLGAGALSLVRPHVALLALGAFGVATIIRARRQSVASSSAFPFRRFIGVAVLVLGFSFALSQAAGWIPGFAPDGSVNLEQSLDETSRRSEQGGSEIDVARPNSPVEYPFAFFTVMFRPILVEADSPQTALAAAESTLLLVLIVVSRRRVAAALRLVRTEPYLMMAGLYTLGFAFAWSSMGNLGIIARQRAQVLPFLVLFLAVDAVRSRGDSEGRSGRRRGIRTAF